MCGILGSYKHQIDLEQFDKALDLLTHRGPDGRGVWVSSRKDCVLGHRRLSILDLSVKGKQPMVSSDGRYVITYNGEIYNYFELREELKGCGYQFQSSSDTEVLLYAWAEWGRRGLSKLNGMWAFGLYDSVDQSLTLCRDRFGVKPLYYTNFSDEGVMFASEMKALIPFLEHVTPNREILSQPIHMMFRYETTSTCLINEIFRLQPGMLITIKNGDRRLERWWNTLEHIPEIPNDYEEQVEQFRNLFLDACRIRMRSDVILGTALSGGLDSSATICSMAHLAKETNLSDINRSYQHAYCAAFPGTCLDEQRYAQKVTDYLNIPMTTVMIDPGRGYDYLADAFYSFEEIYNTSPIPMMQTYEALRKDGVYVSLDGHGADELLGGYEYCVKAALLDICGSVDGIRLVYDTHDGMMSQGDDLVRSTRMERLKDYIGYLAKHYARKMLHKWDVDTIMDKENEKMLRSLSHMNRTLYNAFHETTLPTILRNYDRYSMTYGVEIRMPFMDYRLVGFAFGLPYKAKLHGGITKAIVRDALRDIMPEGIVNRKNKIGFNTPIVDWIQGPWKQWILDEIHSADYANSSLIEDRLSLREEIIRAINNPSLQMLTAGQIWDRFSVWLWEKYFYKRSISGV